MSTDSGGGAPPGTETRRAWLWEAAEERGIPLRAILVAVVVVGVTYLGARLVYKIRETLLLVAVAGFVALLLNPLVVFVQRTIRRRGVAVGIVCGMAFLAFAGLAFLFGYPLVNAVTHFVSNLPRYISQAEQGKGWVGHLVRRYHVQEWVQKNAPKLQQIVQNLSKPALSLGKGAASLLLGLFVIVMLVVLLLLEGPVLRRGLLRLMDPARAARVSKVSAEVSRAVNGYMLGNFITSAIAGVIVFATLLLTGVPYAGLWALWVALVDFLPMIGGALAGIPTVAFSLTHSLTAGIVVGVVFIIYTQVENHVLNPIVMSRTVRVNPLLVLVAILIGANIGSAVGGIFGGFVATLLAIPIAGSVQVIVRELWHATDPAPDGGTPATPALASPAGLAVPTDPVPPVSSR